MRRAIVGGLMVVSGLLGSALSGHAQEGFALKGGAVFNSTRVESEGEDLRLDDAAGWGIGAEVVLPLGVGIGISGYTAGSPDDFSVSEGSLVVLGEANYFFPLALLPVSPYAGAHVGLGTFSLDDVEEGQRPEADFDDLGFQVGIRFQASPLLGLDAQYRRVSGSLSGEQDAEFEGNQFLLSVTLF